MSDFETLTSEQKNYIIGQLNPFYEAMKLLEYFETLDNEYQREALNLWHKVCEPMMGNVFPRTMNPHKRYPILTKFSRKRGMSYEPTKALEEIVFKPLKDEGDYFNDKDRVLSEWGELFANIIIAFEDENSCEWDPKKSFPSECSECDALVCEYGYDENQHMCGALKADDLASAEFEYAAYGNDCDYY